MKLKEQWRVAGIISKDVYLEANSWYFNLQKASPREVAARKVEKYLNRRWVKQVVYSIIIVLVSLIPTLGLRLILSTGITNDNLGYALLFNACTSAAYQFTVFIIMSLMGFGSIFHVAGNGIAYLKTLPVKSSKLARFVVLVFLRDNLISLITMGLAVPVGGLIVTGSPLYFIASLVTSGIALLFSFQLLVFLASSIGKSASFTFKLKNKGKNERNVLILIYFTVISLLFTISWHTGQDLMDLSSSQHLGPGVIAQLNMVFPAFCFPFINYLPLQALIPASLMNGISIGTSIAGVLIFVGLVALLSRLGTRSLRFYIFLNTAMVMDNKGRSINLDDVKIVKMRPLMALMRNAMKIIFKEVRGVILFITPAILTLFFVTITLNSGTEEVIFVFYWSLLYSGFIPFFINNSLAFSQDQMKHVIAQLPVKPILLLRARQVLMFVFTCIITFISTMILLSRVDDPVSFLILQLSVIPLNLLSITALLFIHALFLRKMHKGKNFCSLFVTFNIVMLTIYNLSNLSSPVFPAPLLSLGISLTCIILVLLLEFMLKRGYQNNFFLTF